MSCPTKQIPPTGRPPPINESIDGIPLMEKKLKMVILNFIYSYREDISENPSFYARP